MRHSLAFLSAALLLGACGGNTINNGSSGVASSSSSSSSSTSSSSSGNLANCDQGAPTGASSDVPVRMNRLGFMPEREKLAVVVDAGHTAFEVRRADNATVVFCGLLGQQQTWSLSGEEVRVADFTQLTTPGAYVFVTGDGRESPPFTIGENVFEDVHASALKAYYFNRASTELEATHAGQFARPEGHPDTDVQVHSSAATTGRPAGTVISAAKGWYDAGDYNKYIVNSGISTYTLLAAFEHFGDLYSSMDVNIPESGDAVADILDEVKWNLDWMEAMQDTDGGVYHKLTTLNFSGAVMPHEATAQRYVVQKGTAATLNFAAVMAVASRVFADLESEFPGKSAAYLAAAERAWQWAVANPNVLYRQPADVRTGAYGDNQMADEFAWAAAELFIGTGDNNYLAEFKSDTSPLIVPWWGGVKTLGYISLAEHSDAVGQADLQMVQGALLELADVLLAKKNAAPYQVAMDADDFVWGSNSGALNQAMVLISAYRVNGNAEYLAAATAQMDYVLGRNATGYAFVTGVSGLSPVNIHHRPSEADGIDAPVPGFLAGGPHAGQQDSLDCDYYDTDLPAKSYVDRWCSYATNEITINWNAPLVYVLGALREL